MANTGERLASACELLSEQLYVGLGQLGGTRESPQNHLKMALSWRVLASTCEPLPTEPLP